MSDEDTHKEESIRTAPPSGFGSASDPCTFDYAGRRIEQSPPRLSLPTYVLARRLAIAGLVFFLLACVVPDVVFLFGSLLSAALSAIALVCLAVTAARTLDPRLDSTQRISSRRLAFTFLAAGLLFASGVALAFRALAITRDVSKATVTTANLRGIAMALGMYHSDFGIYPVDLDSLVSHNLTSPKQLIAINDRAATINPAPPYYSSFAFFPWSCGIAEDPALILAFEKEEWNPQKVRLFPRRIRFVLFADEHVLGLDAAHFRQAVAEDQARRRKKGLPVFDWDDQRKIVVQLEY